MKQGVDSQTQEIFEDMADDLAKSRRTDPTLRRQKDSYASNSSGKFGLLFSMGAVILILLLVLLFRGSGRQDLTPIQERLEKVEKKSALADGYDKRIEYLENQIKSLQQVQSKLETSDRSLADRIERLSRSAEKAPPPAPAQKEPVQSKAQVYEIRPGDTLYGVASKHGLTLDQLLRLNNLKKNAAIQPGQKLLIAPERP